ncbi:hypothetical protein MRB53_005936 [Persea americana]|uniref:Uncharacterized protein n=1 Tax=Persea americana TaxID=3435 RepID=A0ACC2MFL7_PERAE|nr:hypothetical protein MRB53_005936 [Persea americana]
MCPFGRVVNSSWTNGRDTINTQFVTQKVSSTTDSLSLFLSPPISPSSSTDRTITLTGAPPTTPDSGFKRRLALG